ncbi:alpha/beta hydrolase [Gordonia sp. CPCC 206044]|uniref:alpha/beta fold hydrolase n=1 Tax=Gordonia sp. CPCC 206044 TaxID=3140793 RepID=UPI003AF3B080
MSTIDSAAPTPVVLVHGLRVSGSSLRRITAGITDRPVRTPDLPGHGTRSADTFDMDGAVRVVVEAIDALGAPAVVAGMSLGGYVSMAVAGRHPERVRGLVVMCATTQPSRMLASPFRAFGAATSVLPAQAAVISKVLTRAVVGRQVAEDMEAGGLALHSIRDVVGALSDFDALAAVGDFPGPTAFVNGGRDQFRLHEQRFLAASDHAELQVIPGASHLFPLIQPARTAGIITAFAQRCDRIPTR